MHFKLRDLNFICTMLFEKKRKLYVVPFLSSPPKTIVPAIFDVSLGKPIRNVLF